MLQIAKEGETILEAQNCAIGMRWVKHDHLIARRRVLMQACYVSAWVKESQDNCFPKESGLSTTSKHMEFKKAYVHILLSAA